MFLRRRLVSAGLIASAATLIGAASAQAGVLATSGVNCSSPALSQPFMPWGDVASYELAPGGDFESGAAGWTLSGGSQVTAGNESYFVTSSSDANSLALPAGSSATSPTMCVGIQNPDLRLFVSNTGSGWSNLQVSVNWEDAGGNVHTTTIANVSGGTRWSPTAQIPILVNLLPLLPGNMTPVSFNFTPQGSAGNWQIDDVYVDPWYRG
jgi:hypothetical protein